MDAGFPKRDKMKEQGKSKAIGGHSVAHTTQEQVPDAPETLPVRGVSPSSPTQRKVSPGMPFGNTERSLGDVVDPDPFVIGLALLSLAVSGATFLENRRHWSIQRQQDRNRFRTGWYNAKRTLLRAKEVIDEFQSFTSEHDYGEQSFGFGQVRLILTRGEARRLRGMIRSTNSVTNAMAAHVDALSEFLGPEHQGSIEAIMKRVEENQRPHSYDAVILLAKDAISSFEELLNELEAEIH